MHEAIKEFTLQGTIAEKDLMRHQGEIVGAVEDKMRISGYVPSLDNQPQWSLSFNGTDFDFTVTVYGCEYEGNCYFVSGISGGKVVYKAVSRSQSRKT